MRNIRTQNRVGYARVSSKGQNIDRQIDKIKRSENVIKIFTDYESGAKFERKGLNDLLEFVREGDIVCVTELDRLGRNNQELTKVMDHLQSKGVTLEVLNLPSFSGIQDLNLRRLLFNLVIEITKYQAEKERELIRSRQAQGIAIAKEKGRYRGRKDKYHIDDPKLQHAFDLYRSGETLSNIERLTGINRRTFTRYIKKYNIKRSP